MGKQYENNLDDMKLSNSLFFTVLETILVVSLIGYLFISKYNIPIYDEWELTSLVEHYHMGTLSLSVLNAPHNECRMLYPHLLNLFIILTTKWQTFYLALFNITILFSFYAIFKKNIKETFGPSKNILGEVLILLILIIVFSFKNYEGIISGFILCHFLMILASFLSFTVLQKATWKNVIFSCVLAHIATLSYITGFFAWICIIGILIFDKIEKPIKIQYLLFVTVCLLIQIFFYFNNYHPVINGFSERTYDPLKISMYSLSFLSNNFSTTVWMNISFSIIQLLSIMSAFYFLFKFDKEKFTKSIPFIAFGLFGLLISVITGYGRAIDGISQSLSRRYCVLSMPFSIIFFVSLIIHFEFIKYYKKPLLIKQLLTSFVCLFFVYTVFYQVKWFHIAEIKNHDVIVAKERILKRDFFHKTIEKEVYTYPEFLEKKVDILKKYKLSLYYISTE
jgi:hypothetical protein